MTLRFEWRLLVSLLQEAWPVWVGALGCVAPLLVSGLVASNAVDRVLYAGTLLEIIGIGLVAGGLANARRLFGKPTLLVRIGTWFRRLRLVVIKPDPVVVKVDGVSVGISTGSVRLSVSLAPGAPLHKRISKLEADFSELRQDLDKASASLRADVQNLRTTSEAGLSARRQEIGETKRKLEEFAVGGLHIEWFGLVWLLVGTLFTNIPDEIVRLWARFI